MKISAHMNHPENSINTGESSRRFSSSTRAGAELSRTRFLRLLCGGGSLLGVAAHSSAQATGTVRLASVVTPKEGGLYDDLLPDFEKQTGYRVELTTGEDVYGPARAGQADIVISHYGHQEVKAFVSDGFGLWPRTVFFNQLALLGPPDDPARIRGVGDLLEAYRRIALSRTPYIVNDIEGLKSLGQILWNATGRPDRSGWYFDDGLREQDAVAAAVRRGGYMLWGLTPFLTSQQTSKVNLEPVFLNDSLLQRIMVSIVVKPEKAPGVNVQGATALQNYLLSPATQARIHNFRLPGIDGQIWWPAGRNNLAMYLPSE